jgi:uncharacterized membrane protein SpoIIM required for sporulation
VVLPATLKQLGRPLAIVIVLGLTSVVATYVWIVIKAPSYIDITPERATEIKELLGNNLANLDELDEQLPAAILFLHNARTMLVILLIGVISFGTLGLTLFIGNFALIGVVLGAANLVGFSPLLLFTVGVLPHGLFELTAVIIGTAAMLRAGALLVSPNTEKSLGETFMLSLTDWFKVFIGLVIPLLAVAAVIEIYVTPVIIKMAFPYL